MSENSAWLIAALSANGPFARRGLAPRQTQEPPLAYDPARWIVLASDGRHSTLGRYTPPDDAEVRAA